MLAAGACRVGATATAAIAAEWRLRGPEAVAKAATLTFDREHLTAS
jgi:hypothetical protein